MHVIGIYSSIWNECLVKSLEPVLRETKFVNSDKSEQICKKQCNAHTYNNNALKILSALSKRISLLLNMGLNFQWTINGITLFYGI